MYLQTVFFFFFEKIYGVQFLINLKKSSIRFYNLHYSAAHSTALNLNLTLSKSIGELLSK